MVMELRPGEINLGHSFERLTDEVSSYMEARRRRVDRIGVRAALLRMSGDRVAVAARLHLLPPEVEHELRQQLAALDDRLAVLRHCDPAVDPRCLDMHEHASMLRARVADQLAAFVCDVDVAIGAAPGSGHDWTSRCLPPETVDSVQREMGELRRMMVDQVDRIADSGLLRLTGGGHRTECVAVAFDAESVERVRAFAIAVRHLGDEAEQAVLWLRVAALAVSEPEPRRSIALDDARRRQARSDLDLLRARQSALAELTDRST
jgi:hypothetical protein